MEVFHPDIVNKLQQFFYKESDSALHSMHFPEKVMFEGFNKNLMLFNYKPTSKNEKFSYDSAKKVWYNEHTNRAMTLGTKEPLSPHSNLETSEFQPGMSEQTWVLVSCEDPAVEEERLKKEAKDAKEDLEGEEVDDSGKSEDDEEGEKKEKTQEEKEQDSKKVIEDQEIDNKKKKEKEEDGEDSAPANTEKKTDAASEEADGAQASEEGDADKDK